MTCPPDPLLLPPGAPDPEPDRDSVGVTGSGSLRTMRDAVSVPPKAPQSPPEIPVKVYEAAAAELHRCVNRRNPNVSCTSSHCHEDSRDVIDAVWPLAVEAVKQQHLARKLRILRHVEAGIPEGLPPAEVDALMAEFLAKQTAVRARQRDAIKAEGLREFVTRLDALYDAEKVARRQAMAFLDGLDRAGYEADCLADFLAPAPDTTETT